MTIPVIDKVRRNHALEHATISILLQRLGTGARLVGRSTASGFYVYGDVDGEVVESAAQEGLRRLKDGEAELAVSPLCGTNLAVAGVLAGVSSLLAIGKNNHQDRLGRVIFAATAAVLAAQPLGRLVQRYLTTSPELRGVDIRRVSSSRTGKWNMHKVETKHS
jgi:hypothetical protein